MKNLFKAMLVSPALFAASALSANANSIDLDASNSVNTEADSFLRVEELSAPVSLDQVTSVSQLSDVQPTDWAFQALQSLVERYGCIAGYPAGSAVMSAPAAAPAMAPAAPAAPAAFPALGQNGEPQLVAQARIADGHMSTGSAVFRGNRALTRYEFAAGLNACLDQILAQVGGGGIDPADLDTIRRLQDDFSAQLASLRGRVDSLESRIDTVEAQQFSTTTKLVGEVAFTIADSFGEDDDTQTVFHDKIRLQLVSSFTGRDKLFTRLTAGNLGNSFADELGTNEGRFAFDGPNGNDVTIDRLHYQFPVGDDLQVTLMASLGGHHFYADTFNPGLEAGGGANGALSRFGERNPIFRHNLGGQGVGLRYDATDWLEFSAGYLARGGFDSSPGAGLFNGNNSYMGQAVIAPSDSFKFGLTYVHNHDVDSGRRFNFGGTGTGLANLAPGALTGAGFSASAANGEVVSDSFGLQFLWSPSSDFRLGGWAGYTQADLNDDEVDADILNYALTFGFPNLFAPGNMGALVVGAAPYLIDADVNSGTSNPNFDEDVPLHVEALYKIKLSDGITLTPGVIWIVNPNQSDNNDDIIIGAIRTTFSF